jgi:hypothetical protein
MKQSEPFTDMAADIERNGEAKFGGAYVIYPPGGDPVVQDLSVNPAADQLRFWVHLKTEIDAVIQRLDEIARNQQAFRMR